MVKKFVLYCGAAIMGIVAEGVLSGVFTVTDVIGEGMKGSIEDGSHVLINRLAYGFSHEEKPSVGDVVAFGTNVYSEEGEGSILVRRVAASFGDTVEIRDNIFYLNGRPYEKYMSEAALMEPMERIVLKENQIFVLCDNRKASMDSRNEAIGIIDSRECIGRVCFK